jgi:hypothetical protein
MDLSFVRLHLRVRFIKKLRKPEVVDAARHGSGRPPNESIIIAIRRFNCGIQLRCVVLFFSFGEPPAPAEPSDGAAIAVGEGLASADPSFNVGRLATPLPLEFGNGVITGGVPRLPF